MKIRGTVHCTALYQDNHYDVQGWPFTSCWHKVLPWRMSLLYDLSPALLIYVSRSSAVFRSAISFTTTALSDSSVAFLGAFRKLRFQRRECPSCQCKFCRIHLQMNKEPFVFAATGFCNQSCWLRVDYVHMIISSRLIFTLQVCSALQKRLTHLRYISKK